MHRFRFIALMLVVSLLLLPMGCSLFESDSEGVIRVMLTDAPADMIKSAVVTITRVYLVPGDDEGNFVELLPAEESPKTYDLLTLRDGLEAFLAEATVPTGTYHQLRLVVENAEVTLAEGFTFENGSATAALKVPSGQTSGIKVKLAAPVAVVEDMVTIVVVDFDVNENFVFQGDTSDPTMIQSVSFQPVLKEKRRDTEDVF